MIHDLEPLRRTAERDAIIIAHFANRDVYTILDLMRTLVPNNSAKHSEVQFTRSTGLSVELGIVYLLDLMREAGSIDRLCRSLANHADEGALSRTHVAMFKRQLAECAELTAFDAEHAVGGVEAAGVVGVVGEPAAAAAADAV